MQYVCRKYDCNLTLFHERLLFYNFAIALPQNSAYKPLIHDFSRRLIESGMHEVIRKKYAHKPLCVKEYELNSTQTKVTLDHMIGIFDFCIACCLLSCLILIIEHIVYKCSFIRF